VALGTAVNSALTLGTGTVQPNGIANGAGSAVTGGTPAASGPTADNLIDLVHTVDSMYAMRPSAAFQMRRATIGQVRKLKDTAGNYLYVPAASVGSPDGFMGYPIIENPYVAASAVGAKSVLFGAMDYFYVRQTGGIEIVRSDEAYFTSDQIAWRATVRIDSVLANANAVMYYKGGTA
jgi:HK97 family phage major capsid protein